MKLLYSRRTEYYSFSDENVLTRMGMNAKFIITGDPSQVDLPPKMHSGLKEAMHFEKCS
jgi:phosphate starvation-inducible protein PhoH